MDQATKLIDSIPLPKFDRREVLPVVSIAVAASMFYASYCVLLSGQKKQKFKEIPVPGSAYPYVGHMMSLGEIPGRTVAKWHDELGPIIKLRMGVQNWFMISDPTLAHKVFVKKGAETSSRPHNVFSHDHHSIGGMGISFSQPNGRWKVSRAAAISVLGPKRVEAYMPLIQQESKELVNRLIESSESEGSVNPFVDLELNSMNIMFKSTFGRRFDSIQHPEFVKLTQIIEATMKHCALENDLANFLPIVSVFDYFFGSQSEQKDFIKNERNPFFRRLVKEAEQAEGPNVVKSLVEDGFALTDDETMVLTSDLIIAGTDTVSVSLSWNIAILCRHPDVQYKIFAEIDNFIELNGRIPHFNERSHLPYCISVMKECMRYRPVTPFGLPHTTHEDLYIDNYMIPKGSTIISSMDSLHKRADLYPNPETFIPERFMNNLKTMQSAANGRLENRDHYNFGWGRRMCPAIYLAETEIFSAFVQIYSRCFIEPTSDGFPDIDDARVGSLTIAPVNFKVKFTKRSNALV
ncbi:cytochrome P450 [Thamnidium elegans]|nr:cytochrome P450 [Thamnidium elegans]BDB32856.1 cytochrome P450 monooxygenase [Thamnidium elegans]